MVELKFSLPTTQFVATIQKTRAVVAAGGSHKTEDSSAVQMIPSVIADSLARHKLDVDTGLFQKLELVIDLDDRGFITGLNSKSSTDLSPVLSLVGKGLGLASGIGILRDDEEPCVCTVAELHPPSDDESLEDAWKSKFPQLDSLRDALLARVEALLNSLVDPDTEVPAMGDLATAIGALQEQLAAVSEARRTWIAGHARDLCTETVVFAPQHFVQIPEKARRMPAELGATTMIPVEQQRLADHFGVLLAMADPARSELERGFQFRKNVVPFRRARSVECGLYRRSSSEEPWKLDPGSVLSLDVVDEYSRIELVTLDGSFTASRDIQLEFHPDMSIKKFGFSSSPTMSTLGSSMGEVLDAASLIAKERGDRPGAQAQALAKAKTQLEALQTQNDYEVLAATRNRSVELASLEQLKKIADAQK